MSVEQDQSGRRSDSTRAAILAAARARFAAEGRQKATIRAIAADASIDPAMVMRYFGSKDGLFAAAIDIDLALPDLATVDPGEMGTVLVRHFLTIWEGGPNSAAVVTLLRSSTTDDAIAARFREVFAGQVLPTVLRFGDPEDAPRRSGLMATQLLGLALCRHILRLPPVVAMSVEEIVAEVGPTIQSYLTSTPTGH